MQDYDFVVLIFHTFFLTFPRPSPDSYQTSDGLSGLVVFDTRQQLYDRKLGKLIVNAYLLQIVTYAAMVWRYLASVHKKRNKGCSTGLLASVQSPSSVPLPLVVKRVGVRFLDETFLFFIFI